MPPIGLAVIGAGYWGPNPVRAAQALMRVMGSDLPLEFGPTRGVNTVTRRLVDVSLAAERLRRKAEMGLDEGLRGWWHGGVRSDGRKVRRDDRRAPSGERDDLRTVGARRGLMIPVMRPLLDEEEAAAAAAAVPLGWVAQGPRVAEIEAAFAAGSSNSILTALPSASSLGDSLSEVP